MAASGHPNKLFEIKLLKGVANVEVVTVPKIAAELSYNAQLKIEKKMKFNVMVLISVKHFYDSVLFCTFYSSIISIN